MSSQEEQMMLDARHFRMELKGIAYQRVALDEQERQTLVRRDERLATHLRRIVINMKVRYSRSVRTVPEITLWLKGRIYDATFADWSAQETYQRTRVRFTWLLALVEGDEKRLLKEYTKALNHYIPIELKSYEWGARFITKKSGHRTIEHYWKRTRPAKEKTAEVSSFAEVAAIS